MRVCDVTREDEVTAAYTIIKHDPTVQVGPGIDWNDVVAVTIEMGKRASDALERQDWTGLGKLVPYSLRPKNPKRAEGAKKAQETKRAKAAAAAQEAGNGSAPAPVAPAASQGTQAPAGAKTPVTA